MPLSEKNIYIPIEIFEREFTSRLLVAMEAAARGWNSVLGTKKSLQSLKNIKGGLVLLKSIVPSETGILHFFKSRNVRIVSLDEEGVVNTDMDIITTERYSEETIAVTDSVLIWGGELAALRARYPAQKDKFIATGNPRIDLLRPEFIPYYQKDVDRIKQKYGDYLLICSNFAIYNHYLGENGYIDILYQDKIIRNEDDAAFYQEQWAYNKIIYEEFRAVLPELSKKFPDIKIIFRPHPSEKHQPWLELAEELDNVEIVFEGPVTPWLIGAIANIHNGCTTGLEAHFLGRPVIAYRPVQSETMDLDLPNSISSNAMSKEELFRHVEIAIRQPETFRDHFPAIAKNHEALKEVIAAIEGKFAYVRIVDELEKVFEKGPAPATERIPDLKPPPKTLRTYLKLALIPILVRMGFITKFLPADIRDRIQEYHYGQHKTRIVRKDEVLEKVNKLSDYFPEISFSVESGPGDTIMIKRVE